MSSSAYNKRSRSRYDRLCIKKIWTVDWDGRGQDQRLLAKPDWGQWGRQARARPIQPTGRLDPSQLPCEVTIDITKLSST